MEAACTMLSWALQSSDASSGSQQEKSSSNKREISIEQIKDILIILRDLLPQLPTTGLFRRNLSMSKESLDTMDIAEISSDPRLADKYLSSYSLRTLPLLLELYASQVEHQVRYSILTLLSKIFYFNDADHIRGLIRQNPRVISFLSSVCSARENFPAVWSAIICVELLEQAVGDEYGPLLRREGVIHEIECLSKIEVPPELTDTNILTKLDETLARGTAARNFLPTASGTRLIADTDEDDNGDDNDGIEEDHDEDDDDEEDDEEDEEHEDENEEESAEETEIQKTKEEDVPIENKQQDHEPGNVEETSATEETNLTSPRRGGAGIVSDDRQSDAPALLSPAASSQRRSFKEIIRNLPDDQREAAERLWDAMRNMTSTPVFLPKQGDHDLYKQLVRAKAANFQLKHNSDADKQQECEAQEIMRDLKSIVNDLASDENVSELALKRFAAYLGSNGTNEQMPDLTSFELLESGLVDALLKYLGDGTTRNIVHKRLFVETIMGGKLHPGAHTLGNLQILTTLVEKLQECIRKLENLEITVPKSPSGTRESLSPM